MLKGTTSAQSTSRPAGITKLLAAVLVIVCLIGPLGLTGCSGSGDSSTGSGGSQTSTDDEPQSASIVGDDSANGGASSSGANGNASTAANASASTGGTSSGNGTGGSSTSGAAFKASFADSAYDTANLTGENNAGIDTTNLASGYVVANGTSESRLKFQVTCGDASYNYDLPSDGTPIVCPLNMGNGSYSFKVLQNTSGNRYVTLYTVDADVSMTDEFQPFIRPNVFCDYDSSSQCVALAKQLTASAGNQGDAADAIFQYVIENIAYDNDKAAELSGGTGYVPDPDQTLADGSGICFDYASLTAAMMRSVGIPTKVMTGYVTGDLYHAWNMVYLDGTWQTIYFSVDQGTWTRIDATFAAAGSGGTVGDGTTYTDRYTY